jgi:hypothetical protein
MRLARRGGPQARATILPITIQRQRSKSVAERGVMDSASLTTGFRVFDAAGLIWHCEIEMLI